MPRRRVLVLSALATCAPVALSYSPWRSLPRSAVLTLASRERRTKARAVATGDATETAAAISEYDHTAMEAKWQQYWEAQNTFATRRREGKDKKYVLDMFPYPSGAGLHVGHPEGYSQSVSQSVITKLLPVEHMVHYTHSVFRYLQWGGTSSGRQQAKSLV